MSIHLGLRGAPPDPAEAAGHDTVPTAPVSSWGRLPLAAMVAAFGLLLIACAYTAGRYDAGWGVPLYWCGVALGFLAVAGRLLVRSSLGTREPLGLALVVAVFSFLSKLFYSPLAFRFPDELQHWRSTSAVLQTHQLFTANPALPISPHYPGLELVTASVSSVTGLSIFASGIAVTATAHVIFVLAIYAVFGRLSGSDRVAAVAVLIYSLNGHFASFDAMFVYQTLGLTFLALTLLAAVGAVQDRGHARGWTALAVLSMAATIATHHVTSYLLIAGLFAAAIVAMARRREGAARWRTARIAGGLALGGVLLVALWIIVAAPQTIDYLRSPISGLVDGARRLLLTDSSTTPAADQVAPIGERVLGVASAVLVAALLPLAWLSLRRQRSESNRRLGSGTVAMMLASSAYFAVLAIRVAATGGQELAGRLMSFEFIPTAYVLALFAVTARSAVSAAARDLVTVGGGSLLCYGAVVGGWPPWWERLPGPYQVAGFERSVDAEALAAAAWAPKAVGGNRRFGADAGNAPVIGTYGQQDVVRDVASLYKSTSVSPADITLVSETGVRYLLVDFRMARRLPASGAYFPVDPKANTYRKPLPLSALQKFDGAGASRLYDSGDIVVWDLRGSDYAP